MEYQACQAKALTTLRYGVVTDTLTHTHYPTVSAGIGYTTTRVITCTYESAASLKRSERDKLYRLTGI